MHNINPTDRAVEQAFIAKAALAEQRKGYRPAPHPLAKHRPYSREDMLRIGREIKNAVQFGNDATLKSYGFSLAGIEYYLETRLGLEPGEANVLAHGLRHILESGAV